MIRADVETSLESALAVYFERVDRGEAVSEAELVSEYPQCAAELQKFFDDQRRVNAHVKQLGSRPPGSSCLHIRCPHCRQTNDVAVDSTFTGLKCRGCGSQFDLVDPAATASAGAPASWRLGRFRLIERVGAGAFGAVWKARDEELDRTVAIKIPRRADMSPEEQEKFFREARAAAQLRHPHIVSVHEAGREGDSIYIVSDFVQGVTLADWLTGQRLTGREAAELCAAIADALEHAHQRGVVHRDLKPANIMIDADGSPHLMDFGLARRAAGEVTLTIDGQVLGTPAYMSPEQAEGRAHQADRRSDVYSLGVILFQLLTGELPFRGNARMIVHQVIYDDPPSPRQFNAHVNRDLETITLKCLEKQPARRYATAADAAADLRRFLRSEPIAARPLGAIGKTVRWVRRKPAAAAFLLLLAASSAFSAWLAIKATRAERVAEQRLATGLLSAGDAALTAGKAEGRDSYRQAWAIFKKLGLSELPATTGLLASYIDQPPPLMGSDGHGAGPGGFVIASEGPVKTALMPDGRHVLTHDNAAGLQLWDVRTGMLAKRFNHVIANCTAIAISPSGERFATATGNKGLQLRSGADGQVTGDLVGHEQYVTAIAFSPDGGRLASGAADMTVRVWDVETGAQLHKFDAPSYVNSVAFTADGRRVVSGGEPDAVVLWDLEGDQAIHRMSGGGGTSIVALAMAADGKSVLSGSLGRQMKAWDLEDGKPIRAFQGHSAEIRSLDLTPDGRRALSGSTDKTMRLWDVESGNELGAWTGQLGEVAYCRFLPNPRLAVTADPRGSIKLWDLDRRGEFEVLRGHEARVVTLAVSSDGRLLLTGSFDKSLRLWDAATGLLLRRIETGDSPVWGAALTRDARVAASTHEDGNVYAWEVATGRKLNEFKGHGDVATAAAFSPDGGKLLTSSYDKTLKLWSTKSGESERTLVGHVFWVRNVAMTPDGRSAFSCGSDNVCNFWDLQSGELVRSLRGHAHRVHAIAFDADAKVAVTSGWDKQCCFWDVATGTLLDTLKAGTDQVTGLAVSPDNALMLTGGLDGQVTLWDFRRREMVRRLVDHGEPITSAAFCENGRTIVCTSQDGAVKLWRLDRPQRYREFASSLASARAALQRHPQNGEALAAFGRWYALRGVDDWAAEFLEGARAAGANISHLELARCYWKLSQYDGAAREFRLAMKQGEAPVDYLRLCLRAVESIAGAP